MASPSCRNAATLLASLALLAMPAVARGQAAAPGGGSVSAEAAGDAANLPFRGSAFILDQSTTPETLVRNAQQSPISSYQLWLSLRPRWYFTKTLSLRARVDLTTEYLAGLETTKQRQPLWGDVWTELVYSGIPELAGIKSSVGIRALWPSSLSSQVRGNYVQLGLTANLGREFRTRIGSFELGLLLAGTHPFTRSTSGGFITDGSTYECMYGEIKGSVCDQLAGSMNPYFVLTSAVSARYAPIEPLSINLSFVVIDSWKYNTVDASLDGGSTLVDRSPFDTRFTQASWFSASVDYDATRWLSLGLGYYVYRNVLAPDGTYGNPFWAPGGSSRLYFSMTFGLDQIYQSIYDRVKKSKPPAPAPAKVAVAAPAPR